VNLRIKNIFAQLEKENLDGLIISSQANISYLTEFISRDSYLLISKKGNVYFTDSRYTQEAKINLKRVAIIEKINGSVFNIIVNTCRKLRLKRVGFEERNLAYGEYKNIEEGSDKRLELIPTHSLVENLRQIKSKEEIEKIKEATRITIEALKFVGNFISPGIREIEIAAELERFIRYQGARTSAFEIIVASGPNSSFPHHITSQRKIKNNEPVLIDLGVEYLGYKSDLTRVLFLGKINAIVRRVYSIVLEAQERAIRKIKPDVSINKIDTAARQYIARRGYGGFFGHNLGHGIGLEIHEEPHISKKENNKLKSGMVFTVEPAIYLPDKFGIRIEDTVLVTRDGSRLLSGGLNK